MATFLAGATILAATHEDLVDAWDTYTPTWTAATPPAIGNGSISGRYKRVGSNVDFSIAILMGTTTTYGVGQWSLSLPVAPVDPGSPYGDYMDIGRWTALDTSATGRYHGPILRNTGSTVIMLTSASGVAVATIAAAVPFTWASTDRLTLKGRYECAAP